MILNFENQREITIVPFQPDEYEEMQVSNPILDKVYAQVENQSRKLEPSVVYDRDEIAFYMYQLPLGTHDVSSYDSNFKGHGAVADITSAIRNSCTNDSGEVDMDLYAQVARRIGIVNNEGTTSFLFLA